mgnify:CR=1 FL=1
MRSGAICDPGVLADFQCDADAIDVKNRISDGDKIAFEFFAHYHAFRPGAEPTGLVVEAIAGEILFCDEACDLTIDEKRDGIVNGIFDPDGEADGDDEPLGFGCYF